MTASLDFCPSSRHGRTPIPREAGMSDQPFALYRLGDEGAGVRDIRERLLATGDLREDAGADVYDESVRTAVRSFQQRRGLIADGVVGPHTWVALDGARWRLGDRV